MKKRNDAIADLRQWGREMVSKVGVDEAHRLLILSLNAVMQEFRKEFVVEGTRYYEDPDTKECRSFHILDTRINLSIDPTRIIYLTREEFSDRHRLHDGYENAL